MGNLFICPDGVFYTKIAVFKILSSYFIAFTGIITCVYASLYIGYDYIIRFLAILMCLIHGCIGWSTGLLITTPDEHEQKEISDFGKTVTALISGLGISHIKDVFKYVESRGLNEYEIKILIIKTRLFLSCFFIATLITFISRSQVKDTIYRKIKKREIELKKFQVNLDKLKSVSSNPEDLKKIQYNHKVAYKMLIFTG